MKAMPPDSTSVQARSTVGLKRGSISATASTRHLSHTSYSTGEISSEIQSSSETWGVMDKMVPMVIELTMVCWRVVEVPAPTGTILVLVL